MSRLGRENEPLGSKDFFVKCTHENLSGINFVQWGKGWNHWEGNKTFYMWTPSCDRANGCSGKRGARVVISDVSDLPYGVIEMNVFTRDKPFGKEKLELRFPLVDLTIAGSVPEAQRLLKEYEDKRLEREIQRINRDREMN